MPTQKEIAEAAGVSHMTVYRCLTNKPNVSEKTKKKIEQIVRELEYRPHHFARGLALKRTEIIGLLVESVWHSYYPEIIDHIQSTLSDRGYKTLLCLSNGDPEREADEIGMLLSLPVDGIIIAPTVHPRSIENCKKLVELKKPVVMVTIQLNEVDCSVVRADPIPASRELVQHLIDLGHRKIAHITGSAGDPFAAEVLAGYKQTLKSNIMKLNKDWVFANPNLIRLADYEKHGYESLNRILNLEDRPTAIQCLNDVVAIGVYQAAQEKGIRIPEDIALVGFSDVRMAQMLPVPLTTAREPTDRIGEISAEILLELIEKKRTKPVERTLDCPVIIRASSGGKVHEDVGVV